MMARGVIELQSVPALGHAEPIDLDKTLNPESLIFRLHGYDVDGIPGVKLGKELGDGGRLHLRLDLKNPDFLSPGWKHLFADVFDRRGGHSHYVDVQFELPEGEAAAEQGAGVQAGRGEIGC